MSAPTPDPRPRRTGTGSQGALRAANRARVLAGLRDRGPSTQAELSRATGLSAATISNLVRQLVGEELVTTGTTTSSGRRAVLVSLAQSPGERYAVGIDVGRRHLRVVAATPSRHILAEEVLTLPLGHHPAETIDRAGEVFSGLVATHDLDPSGAIGCGVGIPGPIDARTGQVAPGAILPEWVGLPLSERFSGALGGLDVHVGNDADLGAVAEAWWGDHGTADHLAFVKIASGIGAGLVLGGRLHTGHIGITGEIGHTGVTEYGEVCRCGSRGCLETIASVSTMLRLVEAGGLATDPTVDDLLRLARHGDPAVLRIVEDAGLAVGRVLGSVVNLLGLRVIVVGGPLIPLGDLLLDPVRRGLARWSSPVVASSTTVVTSSLGGRAEALGACAQVIRTAPDSTWI